jgi:chorismate mutase
METKSEGKKSIAEIWKTRPLVVAGPCSAETEEQIVTTAQQLAETGKVHIYRAGIWKPRTRPGSFEGIGTKGLPWMLKAKQLSGLPTTVEIANAKQVEDALHFEVDVLWIGARTSVNPISMQEIADSLRGVDIPVLIKNPINPDLELWTGAVERIAKAGIKNIGLVHRGFSVYGVTEYRYAPMWHLAIEMKRRNPDLLMLCDPAHISGRTDIIQAVAQKAIDLDYDGIMIESHCNPEVAWTDKKQQVKPSELSTLLDAIVWRREKTEASIFNTALEKLREQINQIDDEVLQLLGRRMGIAEQIGQYKKDNKVTILQPSRWSEIFEKTVQKAESLGLSRDFTVKYLDAIHEESINRQNTVMNV